MDLPCVLWLCGWIASCMMRFMIWNLYQMTSRCFQFCFHQVWLTVDIQHVVFGVFWKSAWSQHVWKSFNDGWGRFRGEQHFVRMCFWRWVWNLFWLACRFCSPTTTSKQLYFKLVLHVNGLRILWRRTFIFWTGICGWLECICNICKCMLMETTFLLLGICFSGEWDALLHDVVQARARQNKRAQCDNNKYSGK